MVFCAKRGACFGTPNPFLVNFLPENKKLRSSTGSITTSVWYKVNWNFWGRFFICDFSTRWFRLCNTPLTSKTAVVNMNCHASGFCWMETMTKSSTKQKARFLFRARSSARFVLQKMHLGPNTRNLFKAKPQQEKPDSYLCRDKHTECALTDKRGAALCARISQSTHLTLFPLLHGETNLFKADFSRCLSPHRVLMSPLRPGTGY